MLKEQMMQKTLDLYNGDSAALANGKDAANPEKVEEENKNQGPVIYEKIRKPARWKSRISRIHSIISKMTTMSSHDQHRSDALYEPG